MSIEPLGRLQLELPLDELLERTELIAKAESNEVLIGQQRAKQALAFALELDDPDYHVFVAGDASTGKFSLVQELVQQHRGSAQLVTFDYCYVHNFKQPKRPCYLMLRPGHADKLASGVARLVTFASQLAPMHCLSPSLQLNWLMAKRIFDQQCEQALSPLRELATSIGARLEYNYGSLSVDLDSAAALVPDGELLSRFSALLDQTATDMASWRAKLSAQRQEWLRSAVNETINQQLTAQLSELRKSMIDDADESAMVDYLTQLAETLSVDIAYRFSSQVTSPATSPADVQLSKPGELLMWYEKLYLPNIIVDGKTAKPTEPYYEPNPTYERLFGRIEPARTKTDSEHTQHSIAAGVLHHANHDILILDIARLQEQPEAWNALKLALSTKQLAIPIAHEDGSPSVSARLQPEPIQLNIKLILLGSREWYYALQEEDDEFTDLCRVLVEFDDDIPLSTDTVQAFIRQVIEWSEYQYQMNITRCGIARLLESSLKKAEHRLRLSANIADVRQLICEAAYFCQLQGDHCIRRKQVEQAINARRARTGRTNEVLFDDIRQGHVLISTSGGQVGTVNGLTIMDVGAVSFGLPAKISATVHAGTSGVVDIEREVELGQPIHSKGVMLLNGYLGFNYAQHFPLTLSANIALEQSYGYIDGDSASLGELVALLSAIANLPVTQSIAVTGSLNQYGGVQSIGGINEKIEGFFRLCQERGLNGEQGVVMPKANLVNLVLERSVIDAVDAGKFSIYAIEHVDQAIELLIGIPAGKPSRRGRFPKNSVHGMVQSRLYEIASILNGADDVE